MEYSPDHDALRAAHPALRQPGLRRAAVELTRAELETSAAALGGRSVRSAPIVGGVSYVTFTADELTERDLAVLGNLSAGYALFAIVGELLRPIEVTRLDRFDDDLITIQKYPGKTNEQFTKLLLNVTLLASAMRRRVTAAGGSGCSTRCAGGARRSTRR